ncbi:MAG: ABC transporter ATP-binding protein [Alphaproteobacteria bacterium]|nr:ABC transporter ATP-binding protein [Alphaproteobacteria bacterium]
MPDPLLTVTDLSVTFRQGGHDTEAVKHVSFSIEKGQTLALVGESGSGKTVTALSVLKLLPPSATLPNGEIRFDGIDIVHAGPRDIRRIRGNRIGMIFQEPMTSLNPLHTLEKQIAEPLMLHQGLSKHAARARVLELLDLVELHEMKERLDAYPHQLSGGQRQRVMIAMALANEPELLIADEPTTALDVTIAVEILALLKKLQAQLGMAMLFITHDLTIVRRMAHRVCVMKDGAIVENEATETLFTAPKHPYTQKLLAAEPKGSVPPLADSAKPLVICQDLNVEFPKKKSFFGRVLDVTRAVDSASLVIREGETLGIVGESGSGKTTLALALLRLLSSRGTISMAGQRLDSLKTASLRPLRKEMQIVFQDPYSSLNPRMTIAQIVGEGLTVHEPVLTRMERDARIDAILTEVGLGPAVRDRYPHEFSGGQRQRINIARAAVLKPRFIVLDEPTSALDLILQAQIIDLLKSLQKSHGLTYIFISHDLRVVKAISHNVAVMKSGKIVEYGPSTTIFSAPKEAYTQRLISAAFAK